MPATELYNSDNAAGILNHALDSTNSDLIIFMIVLLVGFAFLAIPMCILIHQSRKDSRRDDREDRKMILDVVNRNTEAFSDLRTSLVENNAVQNEILKNINKLTSENKELLVRMTTKQLAMNDKVDKIVMEYDEFKELVLKVKNNLREIIKTEDDTNRRVEQLHDSIHSNGTE